MVDEDGAECDHPGLGALAVPDACPPDFDVDVWPRQCGDLGDAESGVGAECGGPAQVVGQGGEHLAQVGSADRLGQALVDLGRVEPQGRVVGPVLPSLGPPVEGAQAGEVVAAGKGKVTEDGKLLPLDVKVGDRVLFSKYGGTEVKIDGEEYLIMREDDILGIVEK